VPIAPDRLSNNQPAKAITKKAKPASTGAIVAIGWLTL
jgi:hypothetical protein